MGGMQEFSSISVSSYEAGSLADKLTEQSRDGWSVAGIVQAGSSITAYLSRDVEPESTSGAEATDGVSEPSPADNDQEPATGSAATGSAAIGALGGAAAMGVATGEPSLPTADEDADAEDSGTDDAQSDEPDTEHHDEPADATDADSDGQDGGDQIDDLPGWAAVASSTGSGSIAGATGMSGTESGSIEEAAAALPEVAAERDSTLPDGAGAAVLGASALGADAAASEASTAITDSVVETGDVPASTADTANAVTAADAAASASSEATAADTGAAAEAAAAGAAPAGWYADPSSRFELRYWDGTQWTEHVSRAGQQYTDPPIA